MVSIYNDNIANDEFILEQIKRLYICFPDTNKEIFKELFNRIKANEFTEKRLQDAIDNIIDTHTFKTITVADVISYDKTIDIYSYVDVCNIAYEKGAEIWDNFSKVVIGNDIFYIKNSDVNKIIFNHEVQKENNDN